MTRQGFVVGHLGDRVEVLVTGPWSEEAAEIVRSGVAERLVLNYAHGFAETNLEFLRDLPVRQLVVVGRRLTSLGPLEALSDSLELLHLTTDPVLGLDLTQFPRLVDLSANWEQVRATIESATGLEYLHVGGYSERDLMSLSCLHRLRRLAMTDRPRLTSLTGLSEFPAMRSLGIYLGAGLRDITELKGRDRIEELELEGCRNLTQLDAIGGCSALRLLNVSECGDLASLAPLIGLSQLEVLQLSGSTKILDGDLTPIANLPRLRRLRMQSRRHYQPSVREVQATLPPS